MSEKNQNENGYYFNKVKEKLEDMIKNHGLKYMNIYWGEEAKELTLEERYKFWLDLIEKLENGDYENLTFESDFPETESKINVHDYLNMLDNQDFMLHNPHMEA